MSDLKCAVCGEPWDAYSVRKDGKGDMAGWEAELFLKGAGCPNCEGEDGDGSGVENFEKFGTSLLLNGHDDLGQHDAIFDGSLEKRPKWKMPEPTLMWGCCACTLKVFKHPGDDNHETGELYFTGGAKRADRIYADVLDDGYEPTKVGDQSICHVCLSQCDAHACDTLVWQPHHDEGTIPKGMLYEIGQIAPGDHNRRNPKILCESCHQEASHEQQLESIRCMCSPHMNTKKRPEEWESLLLEDFSDDMHEESDGGWSWADEKRVREVLDEWGWLEVEELYFDPQEDHDSLESMKEIIQTLIDDSAIDKNHWRYAHLQWEMDGMGTPRIR